MLYVALGLVILWFTWIAAVTLSEYLEPSETPAAPDSALGE